MTDQSKDYQAGYKAGYERGWTEAADYVADELQRAAKAMIRTLAAKGESDE